MKPKGSLTDRRETFGMHDNRKNSEQCGLNHDSKSMNLRHPENLRGLQAVEAQSFKDIRPEFVFMDKGGDRKSELSHAVTDMNTKRDNLKRAKLHMQKRDLGIDQISGLFLHSETMSTNPSEVQFNNSHFKKHPRDVGLN